MSLLAATELTKGATMLPFAGSRGASENFAHCDVGYEDQEVRTAPEGRIPTVLTGFGLCIHAYVCVCVVLG